MSNSKYKLRLKGTVKDLSEALPYAEAVQTLIAMRCNNAYRWADRNSLYLVKV